PEVQRAFLRSRELRHPERIHQPSDDPRFDQRARVDADDGMGVVYRVVVLAARIQSDWIRARSRIHARVAELRHVDVRPLRGILWVRPHENADRPKTLAPTAANRANPPLDDLDFA